ncbi:MAG: hypothetical protein D6797_09300 [Bdellovibrio sp.]|nr:MAG: hypothetical protein D6797_09300 [Bdellovibrio sp.]
MTDISSFLGVKIAPALTPEFLYPRIVWGGLWGLIFLLFNYKSMNLWWTAFLASLGPSLVQLAIVFPFKAHKGFGGLELGTLTPVLVLIFNFIWGVVAVKFIRTAEEKKEF